MKKEFVFGFRLSGISDAINQVEKLNYSLTDLPKNKNISFSGISTAISDTDKLNNKLNSSTKSKTIKFDGMQKTLDDIKTLEQIKLGLTATEVVDAVKDVDKLNSKLDKAAQPKNIRFKGVAEAISELSTIDSSKPPKWKEVLKSKKVKLDKEIKYKMFGLPEALQNVKDFDKALAKMVKNFKGFEPESKLFATFTEKLLHLSKGSISKPLAKFEKTFVALRHSGAGFFTALDISAKKLVGSLGGIAGVLKFISAISLGGILFFLGRETFINNIGGLATMFSKLRGELSRLFAHLRIATREVLKSIGPFIKILVDLAGTFLLDVFRGITKLLEALSRAPPIIKQITGLMVILGLVLWGWSLSPTIIAIAGLVTILLGLYKVVKWIIDLFKGNNRMNMDLSVNALGRGYNFSNVPRSMSNNTDNSRIITNNVYVQGSGYGRQDGRNIAEELTYMNSISRTM